MDNIHFLNKILERLDNELTVEDSIPKLPAFTIVGAPRAGKSFFHQFMISVFDFAYINNIQAKFYGAPCIGAMVAKEFLKTDYVSNFEGFYGNTFGLNEPHEWGWFWKKWLNIKTGSYRVDDESSIDFKTLISKLASIERIMEMPLLFHNLYATLNIHLIKKHLPNLVALNVKRNPYYVINSYLRGSHEVREHPHAKQNIGNYGEMLQYVPEECGNIENLDYVEQVVLSVRMFMEIIQKNLDSSGFVEGEDLITLDYDEFINNPPELVKKVVDIAGKKGVELNVKTNNFNSLGSFKTRNTPELILPQYKEKIDYYYEKHFAL